MGRSGWVMDRFDRLLARLSRNRVRLWALCLYLQPVPQQPLLYSHKDRSVAVGMVGPDEMPATLFTRPRSAIESRFRDGSICIAARCGSELAGHMWLQFGRLRERMFECDFEALPAGRTCWDYDFEVMPRYRLGRTFVRLWDEAFRLLRERGIEWTASWIHWSNLASRRAHERIGARRVGWLVLLDIVGYKIALCSSRPFLRFATPGVRLYVPVQAAAEEDGGTASEAYSLEEVSTPTTRL